MIMDHSMFKEFRKELGLFDSKIDFQWTELIFKLPQPLSNIAKACRDVEDSIIGIKSAISAGVYPPLDYFRKMYSSVYAIIRYIVGIANEKFEDRERRKVLDEYAEILKKMEEVEFEINKIYHSKKDPELILPHLSIFSDFVDGQIKPLFAMAIKNMNEELINKFANEILYQSGIRKRPEEEEEDEDKKIFEDIEEEGE